MRRLNFIVIALIFTTACQARLQRLPPPPLGAGTTDPGPLTVTALPSQPTSRPAPTLTDSPEPTLAPATAVPMPSLTPTASPPPPSPTVMATPSPPRTTLLFTGVIVPARCVQAAIDARGDTDYPYAEVRDIITQADLAVGTLNATIGDYPPHTGCVPTYVLVGGAGNADALARAGFDVMSVATNHIKNCGLTNCGDRAFYDTLANLARVGILAVGAGANLEAAMRPLVVTVSGVRFGIVSLGQIEAMAFASADTPGIAPLDEANLRAAIAAARQVADVVIAMPHWGPEDSPMPNPSQRQLAQIAVEAGADLVVGNHTHVVQAIQEIDGVTVFYGLGNFVFDQTWARDHQQGVILRVTFEGSRFAGYELLPTHVDGDGTVHLAGAAEADEILARIAAASSRLR
jgi:poly-gamma-glutamate capsule biosynthesis protein CapA/YwtB (metallophosphatase superfamily)